MLLSVRLVDGLSSERGAAIGAGDVMLARGKPATLPSETRISFRLQAPLTLTERL
jgi:hypothetical protein